MITSSRNRIQFHPATALFLRWRNTRCLAFALLFVVAGTVASFAKPGHLSSEYDAGQSKVDVVIFVMAGPNGAEIATAYDRKVPRTEVQQDMENLFKDAHWTPGSYLDVNDQSANPANPKEFPVTTAGQIIALNAPQYINGYPQVMPYLRAFQRFHHIEIDFTTSNRSAIVPSFRVSYPALTAVVSAAQGTLRYDVIIRDHKGPLPDIGSATRIAPPVPNRVTASHTSQRTLLVVAAVLLAVVMVAGVAILLIARSRTSTAVRASGSKH